MSVPRLTKKQKMAVLNWFWMAVIVAYVQQKLRKLFHPGPSTYLTIISLVKKFNLTGPVVGALEIFWFEDTASYSNTG